MLEGAATGDCSILYTFTFRLGFRGIIGACYCSGDGAVLLARYCNGREKWLGVSMWLTFLGDFFW
jgi:hypothetical protein